MYPQGAVSKILKISKMSHYKGWKANDGADLCRECEGKSAQAAIYEKGNVCSRCEVLSDILGPKTLILIS